jgi:hypothetical protein
MLANRVNRKGSHPRRLAITLIKNETSLKDSIRSKRIRAGYDTNYLEKILAAIPAPN